MASDEGDDRQGWIGNRTPAEQLATLSTRMFNLEREVRSMRTEAKEGRDEFRDEIRERLVEIRGGKADAYRLAEIERAISRKADAWHVNLLSIIVLGFVGIILVAVAYNILEARPTIQDHAAASSPR